MSSLVMVLQASVHAQGVLIPRGTDWSYFDQGYEPAQWQQPDYDDREWPVAPAQLGYGDGDEVTRIQNVPTAYFRRPFQIADGSIIGQLTINLLCDDGAVIYLNGSELFRSNLPDGPVSYATPAIDPVAGADESSFFTHRPPASLLRTGENILAIEVHQVSAYSSDLSFDLELRAEPAVPTVIITTPTNGQSFNFRDDLVIEVATNGFGEDVQYVLFFINGQLIGDNDRANPFGLTVREPDPGSFSLSAVAVTVSGILVTSPPVRIEVFDRLPRVSWVEPEDGAEFPAGTNILLSVNVVPGFAPIRLVNFFANGTRVGEVLESSNFNYSVTWSNVRSGSYALQAFAYDDSDERGLSPVIHIRVSGTNQPPSNQPPVISITQPLDGATVRGPGNILIRVNAYDNDGFITRVDLFESGLPIGQTTTPPFDFVWENVALGAYTLTAAATDNDGATITSPSVSFTVAMLPAQLMRGPYLQNGSPTHLTVNWRTDIATESRVSYGTDADNLNLVTEDLGATSDHSVTLTNLNPNTKYFYAVADGERVLASGPDQFFITPPTSAKPTRVWVIGDSGTAGAAARSVRDSYYSFTGERYTDLWLMLGDNAYGIGTDEEYQGAVFNMYPELLRQSVLWPTIGNHDFYSATSLTNFPYLDIFTLPTDGESGGVPSGTEKYYSFDYGNVHFVCLDAMSSDRSSNGVMCTWLQEDLASNTNDWLIAFWHHPPYSRGSHNSDAEFELIEMRQNAVPILETYGADLVLCGHSHSYERSFLLNGHYGFSFSLTSDMRIDAGDGRTDGSGAYRKAAGGAGTNRGTVYTVAGCSGQTSGGALNHPAMFVSFNVLGSVVLDIDGLRLDAKFLQADGLVSDYFTIEKQRLEVPSLRISRNGNQLLIRWPVPSFATVLESTEDLGTATPWRTVTNPTLDFGEERGVIVDNVGSRQFFRLRPSP